MILASLSLMRRELVRFYRQRSRIFGSLGTPIIFWVLLGSGLQVAFPGRGDGFLQYFFPGNLVLTILFTAIFSNISIIEDRHEGFLQSVRVAPLSPAALVLGKVGGGASIAFLQGVLFLCLAPIAGISFTAVSLVLTLVALGVIAFVLTTLGFVFAWKLDSVQGFHGIMNLVLMPMWLLSGAFFPVDRAPLWLKPLMYLNPLTYGFTALKSGLFPETSPGYFPALAAHLVFGLVFYAVALVLLNRREEVHA